MKFLRLNLYSLIIFLTLISFTPFFFVLSQEICNTRQECEALEKQVEEKIAQIRAQEGATKQELTTRQKQLQAIKSRIEQLDLQIRKSNIVIQDLSLQIRDTESSIKQTNLKIEDERQKLAYVLGTIYKEDQKSLLEVLLAEESLSGFFDNLMALETLKQRNHEILDDIKKLNANLENQKQELNEEKETLLKATQVQQLQKQESEKAKKEQEMVLRQTEAEYQKYVKERKELEKRVAEIRARISQLTLPGLAVPKDRKELAALASWAGQNGGGVRPALILGLIEVESALGANVGQCNCSGQTVCRHPELTYKQVMSQKQWSAFESIVTELGLNINTTPVSCYINGGKVQMGGAMGPAQFMPNTWLNLGYKQKVESVTNQKPANPWLARDAFLAAAFYLADWGALSQSRDNEMGAVTAFLCGTSKITPTCRAAGGEWYRNLVMQKADQWQLWINQGL